MLNVAPKSTVNVPLEVLPPRNDTEPLCTWTVPLFAKKPCTVDDKAPESVSVAPASIAMPSWLLRLLTVAPAPESNMVAFDPSTLIVTSSAAPGMASPIQLLASFQFIVAAPPSQAMTAMRFRGSKNSHRRRRAKVILRCNMRNERRLRILAID